MLREDRLRGLVEAGIALSADTDVEVRIEITAKSDHGFDDEVVRAVTENARTLKFEQHGFEGD